MSEEDKKRLEQQRAFEEQLEEAIRQVLTPEARSRLANVRLVNSELYFKAAQAIIYLFQSGKIRQKISEQDLKQLLEKFSEKREIKIKRR